ncbi:SusC/RagA family TonB-linked outer membrane protein [Chitinophaga silvatica]|uniref:SusC/RagA family TonB-linked outer membrane protein n=1 Tax=Chitinophaga silvatica TaxID=2282649 RepID=A0A3E1YEY6_9BACT|nr:SusC/RagA family TonB-linked outer membrane protein [Chitinophaga silvatica]RFS25096.1 SusC/RagA family TonB-linked outer membrane protein [Chitinophaga silvatica]
MDYRIHIENGLRISRLAKMAAVCSVVAGTLAASTNAYASAIRSASPLSYTVMSVSGIVKDAAGTPMPGVVVAVAGTSQAAVTDDQGRYHFNQVPDGATLVFKMLGYVTIERPADKNVINVTLQQDVRTLNEVVVKDGYRVTTVAASTSAIGSVNSKVMENKPFATFGQTLQGQIAGLSAPTTSGQPGAALDIRIRGLGSLSLNSNPLIVIDGMIVNSGKLGYNMTTANALSGLNQNDIESIDVLKDAAATALYGSRGSTGVIIITTKRGKSGKTQVRVDVEKGFSSQMAPPAAGRPLSGPQYAELFREALKNGGATQADIDSKAESYGLNSGKYYDWYDLVTRQGQQQQYNVSFNGGTEKTKIFGSAGYYNQEATTIGADLKRISGLFNFDHELNKRMTLSAGINVSNVGQNTPTSTNYSSNPTWASRALRPFQRPYNDDGSINSNTQGETNFSSIYNPLWIVKNDKKYLSETRLLGNIKLKWNIWDKLNYTSYFSSDYNTLEETSFFNSTMGEYAGQKGRSKNYYVRYFNWLTRNQFDYRYDFKGVENFYATAAVGYEAQRSKEYLLAADGIGFPAAHDGLTALTNAATPVGTYGQYSNYSFVTLYGLLDVNYRNRFAINSSIRRDGSSRFAANNKYANFYSIGGTWNVHQEEFFKQQHILSFLKLRSSYGTTGNANLGNYDWVPQASYGATFGYAGLNGQQYNVIGNIDLRWETAKKFDVGADFGFANDRFMLTVDYYRNNIDGLIRQVPTSYTTGFGAVNQNLGAMMNKGWEFTLKGDVVRYNDFTWYTNFNLAMNRNEITRLPANTPVLNNLYYLKEGYNYSTYYMKEYAGADPENGDPLYYTDGTHSSKTNNIANAQYVVLDRQAIPKYTGGFNNVFSYKGITLGVDFTYNLGYWVSSNQDVYFTNGSNYLYNKYQYIYDNRWTHQGQETYVPKFTTKSDNSVSTYRLYKGDHIRLKNISLGYDFKNINIIRQWGVNKLYVYGRATNLHTWTFDDRLPFDPEVSFGGADSQGMLQFKTYTLGINVGF